MEDKRLDFDAPLLSVRRFTAAPADSSTSSASGAERARVAAGKPPPRRSSLPFYKPDLKSGPVRNPGLVPFVWEQTAGRPKDSTSSVSLAGAPKPPPGAILNEKEPSFSDGRMVESSTSCKDATKATEDEGRLLISGDRRDEDDDISSTESFFMNCSTSGSPDATEASGHFSTDPKVRDFMMGRFLPAAQAMASGLRKPPAAPKCVPARPAEKTNEGNGLRPLDADEEEDDDEKDYDDVGHSSLKTLPIKTSHHASLVQSEDENSWEAVYKYKLGLENHSQAEESKLTSESNRLTYWSDSQTSSSNRRSTGGVTSPNRNENPQSPSFQRKGFPGLPKKESESRKINGFVSIEKDGRSYWVITPHGGGKQGSGSPVIDRTLYVDSIHTPETLNSKSSSIDTTADTDGKMDIVDKDSEAIEDRQRMEPSLVLDSCETDALQCQSSEVADSGLSSFSEILTHDEMNSNNFIKHRTNDDSLPSKVDDQEKNDASLSLSLLPPPLPKSPSDSWLSRTLPSVSSNNPSTQALLGIQFQPRKQSFRAFSTDPKWETNVKPSKVRPRLVRFAEVTSKSASSRSET